jgi:MYXO-CTERM domain-containing protein
LLLITLAAAGCAAEPNAGTGEATAEIGVAAAAARAPVQLVSGELTAPSRAAPEAIVRDYLAAHAELAAVPIDSLETAGVRPAAGGAVVTLHQLHHGLAVIGGTVTARTDADGRLRWLRSSAVRLPAGFAVAPHLGAGDVIAHLRAEPRFTRVSFADAGASLVVFALGAYADSPRLAWQIDLAADLGPMQALRIHADAGTGAVLSVVDRIQRADEHRARVYPIDPVTTPERTEVTLDRLPAGSDNLTDDSFEVWNCLDRRECLTVNMGGEESTVHFCSFDKLATAGSYGDFLAFDPPEDHTTFGDAFAEVQAYFHLRTALDWVRGRLAAPDLLKDVKFTVVANAPGQFMGPPDPAPCIPGEDGGMVPPADSQFVPLENAFFAPLDEVGGLPPPLDAPTMVFGQGAAGDFAYGGDVAYHEFGHGMFHFIGSREMGGKRIPDQFGTDPSPGGMDEGFADYLAISITGSPVIGKYALGTEEGFRTAANPKTCPADLHGEEHDDSEPWSGALWAIRQALGEEDRATMDAAVLTTMMAITDADDFRTVSDLLVAEMETALGYDAAEAARAELTERGFTDECHDRTRTLHLGDEHGRMFASEPGPGVMQFRIDVPADTDTIQLDALVAQLAASEAAPAATLHLKAGEEAIHWTHDAGTATSDATVRVPITFTPDESQPGLFEMSATATGEFAAGPYHLQIESADPAGLLFGKLSSPSGSPAKADDPGEESGGGCRTGGPASGSGGLLLLLALALLPRRRR